jgi:cytochrome c-type biogenesis protein CcmE
MADPKRQRRLWYVVGGVLVVAFLAYGATSFRTYLTPYVSFAEATRTSGTVQVAGALVAGSPEYLEQEQVLRFGLAETGGQTLTVVYKGVRPANFEDATQVVAVGSYREGAFHAEQLLVKCPSKYQGVAQDVRQHS